jgi:hypothetical protein
MLSSADLVTVLLGGVLAGFAAASNPPGGPQVVDRTADPLSADRDFCCPSAGRFVSVYREYPLSVLIGVGSHRGEATVDLVEEAGVLLHLFGEGGGLGDEIFETLGVLLGVERDLRGDGRWSWSGRHPSRTSVLHCATRTHPRDPDPEGILNVRGY